MTATEIERVQQVSRMALSVFGDPVKAGRWISKSSRALGGRVPARIAATSDEGVREVLEELHRIEHGIYL